MSLISITIEESEDQIIYGFPRYVIVSTNISSNIYYTLDGSDPDIMSDIYLDKIYIPTNSVQVTLKLFATNGTDESAIIEKIYKHENVSNIRKFQSLTDAQSSSTVKFLYPLGTNEFYPTTKYINIGNSDLTVYNPELDGYSNGFNSDGYETNFTNKPYTTENYKIIYSNRNQDGSYGKNVGTLPAEVVKKLKTNIPEETEVTNSLFDPRAMVTFYDASKTKDNEPPVIFSQFVSLQNLTQSDAAKYYSNGPDSPNMNGTFLRSYHDPVNNTLTSYYYDSIANRWLIVKAPYTPKETINNLSGYVMSNGVGARHVYKWLPYQKRFLF